MQSFNDFQIISQIGAGCSSKVYRAVHKASNTAVALKVTDPSKMTNRAKLESFFVSEFNHLSTLKHPNIITAYGSGKAPQGSFIALELAEYPDLCEILLRTGPLSENASRYVFWQLISATQFIHSKNLAHRDLKPENLLIDSNFNLKLIDFAFVRDGATPEASLSGTAAYLPPQAHEGGFFVPQKADSFALGMILFIISRGFPPFNEASEKDPHYKLFKNKRKMFWIYQGKVNSNLFGEEWRELVEGLMEPEENRRWKVEDAMRCRWMHLPLDVHAAKQELEAKCKESLSKKKN